MIIFFNNPVIYLVFVFLMGLVIGSFINVVIFRIPKDESLWGPGSHCRDCGAAVKWFDNIPVISYLLLKGKCRKCGKNISLQYPFVEILTGVCFLFVAIRFGLSFETLIYWYLTFALISICFIDYYHRIIPDILSYSLIIVGICSSIFNHPLGTIIWGRIINSFCGLIAGGILLFLIGLLGKKIFAQEAMGMGDIKLLAGIGAFLGLVKVIIVLFSASLLGSFIGIFLIAAKKIKRRDYIPFGPFISAAAYACIFFELSKGIF